MVSKRKLDGIDYILRICSLYILIWTISPPLQHPTFFRILVLGSALLWMIVSWCKIAKIKTDIHTIYLSVCIFCLLAIIIEWVTGKSFIDATISQMQLIILLLFLLQYVYYQKQDREFIKILAIITFICLPIWQVRTLIEYQINPGVSRLLVRSGEDAQYYASKGVGGYGLVYPSIFSNTALMYFISKSKGVKKILAIGFCLIGVLLVFSSGFLIAVIMMLVSLGCWGVRLFNSKNSKAILLSIILLLMVAFIAIELLLQYSDFIISALNGTFYKNKVQEIVKALRTDEVTGKLEGRTSRYLESLMGLFRYPIIGARLLGLESEIGGHSTLFDLLGLLGIFSIGFYVAIYYVLKSIYKMASHKGFIITVMILFLLNGILNTLVGCHGIIFVIIPGVILLSNTENKNESIMDCSRPNERCGKRNRG